MLYSNDDNDDDDRSIATWHNLNRFNVRAELGSGVVALSAKAGRSLGRSDEGASR